MAIYSKDTLEQMQREILDYRVKRAIGHHRDNYGNYRLKDGKVLTENGVKKALVAQDVNCAICKIALEDVPWEIDHDHETGFFRGILCKTCNARLAGLDTWLLVAAAYVVKGAL